jgi:hypothetical protein
MSNFSVRYCNLCVGLVTLAHCFKLFISSLSFSLKSFNLVSIKSGLFTYYISSAFWSFVAGLVDLFHCLKTFLYKSLILQLKLGTSTGSFVFLLYPHTIQLSHSAGNTKGGSITVPLTSCLTGLESAIRQLTMFVFICKTD